MGKDIKIFQEKQKFNIVKKSITLLMNGGLDFIDITMPAPIFNPFSAKSRKVIQDLCRRRDYRAQFRGNLVESKIIIDKNKK